MSILADDVFSFQKKLNTRLTYQFQFHMKYLILSILLSAFA